MGRQCTSELEQRLQAHGEAFMRMFEDYDSDQQQEQQQQPSSSDDEEQPPQPPQPAQPLIEKLFNNKSQQPKSKAKKPSASAPAPPTHQPPTRAEFLAMRREVATLGATGLDKRARKAFETQRLAKLGVAPTKGPRIPASIGLGMAKKQKKREAAALEAAIDAGMVSRKGLGKARRRAEEKKGGRRDRGLLEDGGALRDGVLRVRSMPKGAPKTRGVGKGALNRIAL